MRRFSVVSTVHERTMRARGGGQTTALQAIESVFYPGRGDEHLKC